jgi:hypothetical protein
MATSMDSIRGCTVVLRGNQQGNLEKKLPGSKETTAESGELKFCQFVEKIVFSVSSGKGNF